MMMKKLDQRGTAALEFCLVAVPFFTLMFAIFDFGRYAITMQSLRALAGAGARAITINNCYVNAEIQRSSPTGCPADPLSSTEMQVVAPFLYEGSLTPTLTMSAGATALTVTASQPGFTMLMPIWGKALNAPSASTEIPF